MNFLWETYLMEFSLGLASTFVLAAVAEPVGWALLARVLAGFYPREAVKKLLCCVLSVFGSYITYKFDHFTVYLNIYDICTYCFLSIISIFNCGFFTPSVLSSISFCADWRAQLWPRACCLNFESERLWLIFPVSAGPKCFLHALHIFFLMPKNLNLFPQFIILYNSIFNEIGKYLWPAPVTIEAQIVMHLIWRPKASCFRRCGPSCWPSSRCQLSSGPFCTEYGCATFINCVKRTRGHGEIITHPEFSVIILPF